MKLKHLFIAIIVFAALYLSACQKDFTPIDNVVSVDSTNNPTSGDSVYLDKYYLIETVSNTISMTDTATKTHYQYDNLKRVIAIIDTSNEPNVPLPKWFSNELYFYNGLDTLPFKKIVYGKTIGGPMPSNDTTTTFYTYNNVGQLLLDSSMLSSNRFSTITGNNSYSLTKYIHSYSHTANKIFGLHYDINILNTGSIGLQYIRRDTSTFDAVGNIIAINSTRTNVLLSTNNYLLANLTYDNKPSAISKLNIKSLYNYQNIRFNNLTIFPGSTPVNNVLTIQQINGIGSVNNEDFTNCYSYNSNGYPFFILKYYPSTSPIFAPYTDKLVFKYKSL